MRRRESPSEARLASKLSWLHKSSAAVRVSLRRSGGTYTHVCASHSEATIGTTGEELESDEASVSDCIFLRTAVSVLESPWVWLFRSLWQLL